MKFPILFLCLMTIFVPAFAEDTQKVVDRKTCEQIKSEIADLSAMGALSDEQQSELNQLKLQQRSYCSVKGGGRRTISRNTPPAGGSEPVIAVEKTGVLTEYLANKKSNCEKLKSEIEKLTADSTDSDKSNDLAEMQHYYDMDCGAPKEPAPMAKPENDMPEVPAKSEEEIAAEFDANLAAGLCGDGTKPNRYGCCTDETFKDLGDSVFACCPKTGSVCFPPIK